MVIEKALWHGLEIDSGVGKRRATQVLRARVLKARRRSVKLCVLRSIGKKAARLHRTYIKPVASYGAAAMGMAPTAIKALRTQCAMAALVQSGLLAVSILVASEFKK